MSKPVAKPIAKVEKPEKATPAPAPKTQVESPPPSPGYNPANDLPLDDPIEPPTPKDEVIENGSTAAPPANEETAKSVTESLAAVAEAASKDPETPKKRKPKVQKHIIPLYAVSFLDWCLWQYIEVVIPPIMWTESFYYYVQQSLVYEDLPSWT